MSETGRNLMVGLFVLLGLAILGVLMVFFGEAPAWLGGKEYNVAVRMKSLAGVNEGTPVYMNGVQVGRVDVLRFVDPDHPDAGVFVDLLVKDEYRIPSTATARVKPAGLGIGRGQLDLEVTPGVAADPLPTDGTAQIDGEMGAPFGDLIPPELFESFEKTVTQVGQFAEKLTPVAQDLHELLQRRTIEDVDAADEVRRQTANVSTVVQRFDQTLKHFNEVVGDPNVKSSLVSAVEQVSQAASDFRAAATDVRTLAGNLVSDEQRLAAKLDQGIDDFRGVARAAMPILDATSRTVTNLELASKNLSEGQGTIGLLMRDPRLYEAVTLSFARLTDLIDTLRRISGGWERQGYVDLKVHDTPLGDVRARRSLGP